MRIAIATTSAEKIRGIKKGFSRFFQIDESTIITTFQKTSSDVPVQPFNFETYEGAKNRINHIMSNTTDLPDYFISCEAGIEKFGDIFFNLQVVCIYEVISGKYFWGKSSGWQIPSNDIKIIKESNLDNYLRSKGIEAIEELLGTENSRNEAVAKATEYALATKRL